MASTSVIWRRWTRVLQLQLLKSLRIFRRWRRKKRRWRAATGILDASAADSTQCLETLLQGGIIALCSAVIVHDGAPGQILSVGRTHNNDQRCNRTYRRCNNTPCN